jgi:hypothetical protein
MEMMTVQPWLVGELLLLLAIANGTPVIAKKVFGDFLAFPLDRGTTLADGQPLFGRSKTIRGVLLSLAVTGLGSALMGLGWLLGLVVSLTAMIGDLFSSFLKRRMKLPPSSMALGLDQIPESLLPALVAKPMLQLTLVDILSVTALFFVGELVISKALYALAIRDRPY